MFVLLQLSIFYTKKASNIPSYFTLRASVCGVLSSLLLVSTNHYFVYRRIMRTMVGRGSKPGGFDSQWDVQITLPDLQKDLLYLNGSLSRGEGVSYGLLLYVSVCA